MIQLIEPVPAFRAKVVLPGADGTDRNAIGRLRKALNIDGTNDPIRTVRSVGYALEESGAAAA